MSKHVLRAAAIAAAILPALAGAAPLSLDQALDLAVQRSEATRSARASVASASEAAHAAGQLPDPMLRAGIENLPVTGPDRFSTTRDFQTMKRIGISQEWLSRDKRNARQAVAEAMVGRESVSVRATAAEVRLQTALAYLDAFYAAEALKLTTRTEHFFNEELEASKARLAASTGGSPEVLTMTAARGMAEDETAEVRQQQSTANVSLQRWVGRPADELVAATALPLPTEQAYVAAAPAVLALQRDIDVARQSAAVAASERKPNWTWEVSYGQRTGYSDMVSVGVTIPLQVAPAERQDRETAAKLALVDKAEAELAEATRTATAEYRALTSDEQRLKERIERFRSGVVMPAQQRTAVAMAAYRSNQTPLASLFEARRAEIDVQRKLLNLQRDLAKTQAQLAFKPLTVGAAP
jgi:cobalt-zinc-cadmium efflux system outer membrane protein